MKAVLTLEKPDEAIPFSYPDKLRGRFHKWIGYNNEHDQVSLYSLGQLSRGTATSEGLTFKGDVLWPVGFHSPELLKQFVQGVQESPEVLGTRVKEVQLFRGEELGPKHTFFAQSPVLARRDDEHLSFRDESAGDVLTRTLSTKMRAAGIEGDARVRFKPSPSAKETVSKVKDLSYRATLCPVEVEGSPEAVRLAWAAGVGHLTGCGFGQMSSPAVGA